MSETETPRLAELTTMGVGGAPARFVSATTEADVIEAVTAAELAEEPWLVLGGGSNIVAPDAAAGPDGREVGFDGTVIHVRIEGIDAADDPDDGELIRVRVGAGVEWDALVARCVAEGWAGLEALSGIPGFAGAAPVQNIGAYGAELSETLVGIRLLDAETLDVTDVPAAELELAYRSSTLKHGRRGVVLGLELRLRRSATSVVAHDQLARALGLEVGAPAAIDRIRDSVIAVRRAKSMVFDLADPDSHGCGSFFVNPIVPIAVARTLPPDTPQWPQRPAPVDVAVPLEVATDDQMAALDAPYREPELVKVSAAWLIERSGITRGFQLPGSRAAISSKHTLAITNRGGATAAEVRQLAEFVQLRVANDFGVVLTPEPTILP